jgi:uncharacterized membrane protein YkoI
MISRRTTLLIALASLAGSAAGLGAVAGDKGAHKGMSEQEEARAALLRGEILPLSRILRTVAQRLPGDVLKVEIERENNVLIYEIKVLTKTGRIRKIKLNARNGAVIAIEDD